MSKIKQLKAEQRELQTKAKIGTMRIRLIIDAHRKVMEKKSPEAQKKGWRD